MGGHGGGNLRGAQPGLVFGKGELIALLRQQLPPVETTKQRHQQKRNRNAPEPDGRSGKVWTQIRGRGRKQAGKRLHLRSFYRRACRWLHCGLLPFWYHVVRAKPGQPMRRRGALQTNTLTAAMQQAKGDACGQACAGVNLLWAVAVPLNTAPSSVAG